MVYDGFFGGVDDLSGYSGFDDLVWFDSLRLEFV